MNNIKNQGSFCVIYRGKKHFLSLGIFIFLAVVLTLPLSPNISSHIPGNQPDLANNDLDANLFLWNTWWFKYSIVDLGQNPYNATTIFYPNGASLAFHTLNPIHNIIALPLQFLVSPITAFNLVFLLGIVLSGFMAHYLAYYLTKNWWGSLLAGLIFAFNPAITARANGNFTLTTTWLIPLFALVLLWVYNEFKLIYKEGREENKNSKKNSKSKKLLFLIILSGFILGLQYWNDFHYFFYLSLFLLLFFVYHLYNYFSPYYLKKFIIFGLVFFASFLITIFPLLTQHLNELKNNSYAGSSLLEAEKYTLDAVEFFTPSEQSTFLSGFNRYIKENFSIREKGEKEFDCPYLGYSLIFLGLLVFKIRANQFSKKEIAFWAVVALFFLILSFGPTLYIFNQPLFKNLMPYSLIAKTPLLNNLRVPSRAVIMVYLGLAILAAYTLAKLKNRKNLFRIFIILGFAGLLFEYLALPFNTQKIERPEIYSKIEADGSTLFEVPFGTLSALGGGSGTTRTYINTYQIWHKHNLLNGYLSRVPLETVFYYRKFKALYYLLYPNTFRPEEYPVTKELLKELKELNINYIIFHQDDFDKYCPPENFSADEFKKYVGKFAELIAEEKNVYLYKVDYLRSLE